MKPIISSPESLVKPDPACFSPNCNVPRDLCLRCSWTDFVANMADWTWKIDGSYDLRRNLGTTESPRMWDKPPSARVAVRHLEAYAGGIEAYLGRGYVGVFAIEFTKAQCPHFHGLLSTPGTTSQERNEIGQLWFRDHGFCRLEKPANREDVAAYAAKYLTKDLSDVVFWPPSPARRLQLRLS